MAKCNMLTRLSFKGLSQLNGNSRLL